MFRRSQIEKNLHEVSLEKDKQQLGHFCLLALLLIVGFGSMDFLLSPPSPQKTFTLIARGLGVAASLAGLIGGRKVQSRTQLEAFSLLCLAGVLAHMQISRSFRSSFGIDLVAWDVLIIFIIYRAIPLRMPLKALLCASMTATSLAILYNRGYISFTSPSDIGPIVAYLVSNIFGIVSGQHIRNAQIETYEKLVQTKKLKDELERTGAARDQLYRILAHDLRSAVGSVGALGKLLQRGEPQSQQQRQQLVELISSSSQASNDLLENMLEWCDSISSQTEVSKKRFSLKESIERNVSLLEGLAYSKRITLSYSPERDIQIVADSRMLDTVVRNLLSNAIKFTSEGGQAKLFAKEAEAGLVEISVADSGVGIDRAKLPRIFDLDRGESTLGTSGEKGTSLGLKICVEYVQKMGGTIWATSEVGKGSAFYFSIPRDPEER